MAREMTPEEKKHFKDKFTQPISMTFTPSECPQCHGKRVVPIVYGEPSVELACMSDRGEVWLGGCVIHPEGNPEYKCLDCMHEFS